MDDRHGEFGDWLATRRSDATIRRAGIGRKIARWIGPSVAGMAIGFMMAATINSLSVNAQPAMRVASVGLMAVSFLAFNAAGVGSYMWHDSVRKLCVDRSPKAIGVLLDALDIGDRPIFASERPYKISRPDVKGALKQLLDTAQPTDLVHLSPGQRQRLRDLERSHDGSLATAARQACERLGPQE